MTTRVLVMTALLGACGPGGIHHIEVTYPTSPRCTTVVAMIDANHGRYRGDTKLEIVDLATHARIAKIDLDSGSTLGVSKRGVYWLRNGGDVEARDSCTGAMLASVSAIRARHPEAGHAIVQLVYDADRDAIRLMNERAEGFMIATATLELTAEPIALVHEPTRPATNWVGWPGEGDMENWALWGTPQRLTRTADILAAGKGPAKPASPLALFMGEILRDDVASAVVDHPQSVLVAYHQDLVDPRVFVSRVARTGEVLWTRDAESFAAPGSDLQVRHAPAMPVHDVHVVPQLGLVFAVVRNDLVAFDPATGEVRWRLSLTD
jgi:hypothetical protein